MKIAIAAALLTAALASPALAQTKPAAPGPAPAPAQCLLHNRIENSVIVDDSTINFLDRDKQVWQVKMAFPCPFLSMSRAGYIMNIHTMDERICKPIDLDIWVNDPSGGRCMVGSITHLTPAQVAAMKKRDRP
jgi:hypothetical protein